MRRLKLPSINLSPVQIKVITYVSQGAFFIKVFGRNITATSTNAGYSHGCHHTSLLVLASTRRHVICDLACDTFLPTEDHSCSSFTQSELNTLTQLSVPLQGRHRTYKDVQTVTALHPAHSSTQPPAVSSDDHSAHPTDPALLMQHSRTHEQPDSHYRITALIPYTVHLLSQVPADFVTHHHPSSLSLAGEYCSGTHDPQYDSPHI